METRKEGHRTDEHPIIHIQVSTLINIKLFIPWLKDKSLYRQIKRECRKSGLPIIVQEIAGTAALHQVARPDFIPRKCKGCLICKSKPHPKYKRPSCYQRNLIYSIICLCCGKEYCGETKRLALVRFKEHHTKPCSPKPSQNSKKGFNDEYEPSAVATHCVSEHNSKFDLAIGVVGRGKSCAHRKCYEGVYCKINVPALNRRLEGGGTIKL